MSLSNRFGTLLIGVGVAFLGIYLQKKTIQGFQGMAPSTLIPTVSSIDKPRFTVDDSDLIIMKDKQIRSKLNMIMINKPIVDSIFIKYITADLLVNLDMIYNEVFNYVKVYNNTSHIYSNADELNKNIIRQLVYTTSDQADMLYSIYYTIPSNIISTDSVVLSDTAGSTAVNNPNVIAESSKQVSAILATLPSVANKINIYLTNLTTSMSKMTTSPGPHATEKFSMDLTQYLNTVDVQYKHLTKNIDNLTAANIKLTVDDNLVSAKKAKSSFLTATISSLQSVATFIQTTLSSLNGTATSLNGTPLEAKFLDYSTDIQSRITSMQAALTAMSPQVTSENFASYMNPYDQPSVNTTQSLKFGMGRKAYIDEVFSAIKLW